VEGSLFKAIAGLNWSDGSHWFYPFDQCRPRSEKNTYSLYLLTNISAKINVCFLTLL
jgi:hypothetical protein